jgi:hypothetical protein
MGKISHTEQLSLHELEQLLLGLSSHKIGEIASLASDLRINIMTGHKSSSEGTPCLGLLL